MKNADIDHIVDRSEKTLDVNELIQVRKQLLGQKIACNYKIQLAKKEIKWIKLAKDIERQDFEIDMILISYLQSRTPGSVVWQLHSVAAWLSALFALCMYGLQACKVVLPFQGLAQWVHTGRLCHYSCARPAHMAESCPLAWLQVLQNSWCWMFMFTVLDHNWWNSREKK